MQLQDPIADLLVPMLLAYCDTGLGLALAVVLLR